MPYRTRRQTRYENIRKAGFVPFEARALSRISPKVPYMLPLMKERYAEYQRVAKRASRAGIDEAEFNKRWLTFVKKRYIMKRWKGKGDTWGVTVAFRMLKEVEREYKYKHPQYDSPWEKRQKQWKDFISKLEATYEKYPKGRVYSKGRKPIQLRYKPEGGAEIIQ